MFKNKFLLGLATAIVLGSLFNIARGYTKFGYLNKIEVSNKKQGPIDKDVKECGQLDSFSSTFGTLKITILGNGKPVENLEVDLSDKPGPNRCMKLTDKNGVVLFEKVPAKKMAIFFNNANFPKEFGPNTPVTYLEIIKDQTIEKIIELKK